MSDLVPCEGVYDGIPDNEYHADKGSLSSSGARKLLPPSCPAIFRWEQDNPTAPKDEYDMGHAMHTMVLGVGAPVVRIDVDSWTTKAAREQRDAARADGNVPLKASDYDTAVAMANSIRRHPVAAALFQDGVAEQSLYWRDLDTGVMLRCRPDWLPPKRTGRLLVVDLKTSTSANPDKFAKSCAEYGYHQQAAWYLDGIAALQLADDAAFLFVVQSKTPPFEVTVNELDHESLLLGRRLNRHAIDVYAECVESGVWPGYGHEVNRITLPAWAHYQSEEILSV
ncbi:Exodeoxyribonuclease 8 [Rhodococcus ruber]|uniref:PD-(D/E)XK nuclease-like domain-containing protein n=1 Tax=Rhodococcus ruber TaxID=1830 RepID=UPI00315DFDF4